MQDERFNAICCFTGCRGAGKTTFVRSFFPLYEKILIVDTLDHPAYRDLEEIRPEQFARWKRGHKRIFRGDPRANVGAISRDVCNALVVFEDARKILKKNLPEDAERLFLDSKQRNCDVFLLYHSLAMVPPFVYSALDYLTIFNTKETLDSSLKQKISNFRKIRAAHRHVAQIAKPAKKAGTDAQFYHLTIEFE